MAIIVTIICMGNQFLCTCNAINMRFLWTYLVKANGLKKARQVCNQSPWFIQGQVFQYTYSGFTTQVRFHVFMALAAIKITLFLVMMPPTHSQTYHHPNNKHTWRLTTNIILGTWKNMADQSLQAIYPTNPVHFSG